MVERAANVNSLLKNLSMANQQVLNPHLQCRFLQCTSCIRHWFLKKVNVGIPVEPPLILWTMIILSWTTKKHENIQAATFKGEENSRTF